MSWLDGLPQHQTMLLMTIHKRQQYAFGMQDCPWIDISDWEYEMLGYPTRILGKEVRVWRGTAARRE